MATAPAAVDTRSLRRSRRNTEQLREIAFSGALFLALLVVLGVLVVLIMDVLTGGWPILSSRLGSFLSGPLSTDAEVAGVWLGILGSLQLAAIVALVAFPVGIGTAIYLEEYAPNSRWTRIIDLNIRNLAGVPSVVYGLLGLAIFVGVVNSGIFGMGAPKNVLAGGLTLSALVLPIVIITSAEAIRAVPRSLREGGYGVGATKWQVTRQLTLPSATPGILTGTILSLSRAIGETAPLLVVGGIVGSFSVGNKGLVERFFDDFTALPLVVFNWARFRGDIRDVAAPAAIVVLLVFTLALNAIAIALRNRYEKRTTSA